MADSWAVKYRPQSFKDVVGAEQNAKILANASAQRKFSTAYFFAGSRGCGKCFDENQLLLTNKGLIKASDLKPKDAEKGFTDFRFPLINKEQQVEETSKFYSNGEKETLAITTVNGYQVVVTPNHPLYVFDGLNFCWKEAKDITEEDYLTLPKDTEVYGDFDLKEIKWDYDRKLMDKTQGKKSLKDRKIPKFMTVELAELMGLYVGDCCSAKSQHLGWKFESDIGVDPDMEETINKLYWDVFGVKTTPYLDNNFKTKSKRSKLTVFPLNYKEGCAFLKYLGVKEETSAFKEIPWSILQSSKKIQQAFIRGLFEADGGCYISDKGIAEIGYASASKDLVNQLQVMLLNIGILSNVRARYNDDYKKDYYYLDVRDGLSREKFKEISFLSERKKNKLESIKFDEKTQPRLCVKQDLKLFTKVFDESKLPLRSRDNEKLLTKTKIYGSNSRIPNSFTGLTDSRITKILDNDDTLSEETKQLLMRVRDDFYLKRVASVKDAGLRFTVDYEMPRSHSFILNGVSSHNTTLSRILAKAMECENPQENGEPCNQCDNCRLIQNQRHQDVIELDAASENSVQGIRDLIKTTQYLPSAAPYKVYIIDECLTPDSMVMQGDYSLKTIDTTENVRSYGKESPRDGKTESIENKFHKCKVKVKNVYTDIGWITATPTHKMLAYKDGKVDYFEVQDLHVGDYFISPKRQSVIRKQSDTKKYDALALFWPLYYQYGSIVGEKEIELNIPVEKDFKYVKDFLMQYFMGKVFNAYYPFDIDTIRYIKRNIGVFGERQTLTIIIKSKELKEAISEYFTDEQEDLWNKIRYWNSNQRLLFLYSYARINKTFKFVFNTAEEARMCQSFFRGVSGLYPTIDIRKYSHKEDLPQYIVDLSRQPHLLCDRYAFMQDLLKEDYQFGEFLDKLKAMPEDEKLVIKFKGDEDLQAPINLKDFVGVQITSISDSFETDLVIDFTVPVNHNFVVNGFVSSNCHALSAAASNALLKTLETPPDYCKFIFATTDPFKVLDTIRSRCLIFHFKDIQIKDIVKRLNYIAEQEGVSIDTRAAEFIAQYANGGLRDAIMLLEQCYYAKEGDHITTQDVMSVVGFVSSRDIQKLFQILKQGSLEELLEWLDSKLFSPSDIVTSAINFLESIIYIKQGVSPGTFVQKDEIPSIMGVASLLTVADIVTVFKELRDTIYDLRNMSIVSNASIFKFKMISIHEQLHEGTSLSSNRVAINVLQDEFKKFKDEFNLIRVPKEAVFKNSI